MFRFEYREGVEFAIGDRMMGKVEDISPRLLELAAALELPEQYKNVIHLRDWKRLFEEIGVTSKCFRDIVHDRPETRELVIPNSGANIVLVATGNRRDYTLVQERTDGKIGFLGGASCIYSYNGKDVWEDVRITADREFYEEVGMGLRREHKLVYFDFVTTTNHYPKTETSPGWPDVYAPSMYYGSEVSLEELIEYTSGKGSIEGKIKTIAIRELDKYRQIWFENAAPVFELLIKLYK